MGDKDRFTAIDAFIGPYAFLSNTYPSPVFWNGRMFPCAACAGYAAQYDLSEEDVLILQEPWKDKKIPDGVTALLDDKSSHAETSDWSGSRRKIMEQIVRDKFRRSAALREQLGDTGSRHLVWSNKTDSYFGRVNNSGQNQLGRVLTELRGNIKDNVEFENWLALNMNIESDSHLRPVVTLVESKPDVDGVITRHVLNPDQPYWTIGKFPTSDVVAANPSVSRQHALMYVGRDGSIYLVDLHSTAGTFLNNEKIKLDHVPFPVSHGGVIRLGVSTRIYTTQINKRRVFEYLEQKKRQLEDEIVALNSTVENPEALVSTETRICVKNLSFSTTKSELVEFFEACGEIKSVILPQPRDRPDVDESRANRGIAFITFMDPIGAQLAMKKNEGFLNTRKISVSFAKTHERQRMPEGSWRQNVDRSQYSRYERRGDRDNRTDNRDREGEKKREAWRDIDLRQPRRRDDNYVRRRGDSVERRSRSLSSECVKRRRARDSSPDVCRSPAKRLKSNSMNRSESLDRRSSRSSRSEKHRSGSSRQQSYEDRRHTGRSTQSRKCVASEERHEKRHSSDAQRERRQRSKSSNSSWSSRSNEKSRNAGPAKEPPKKRRRSRSFSRSPS